MQHINFYITERYYLSDIPFTEFSINHIILTFPAYWGAALGLIGLAMVDYNAVAAMILLTVTVTTNCSMYFGYLTNHLDLAPNLAGVLMGVTNGIANIASFLAPMTAGYILTNDVRKIFLLFGFF